MLKLRVTFNIASKFVQKYYSTKYHLSPSQWDKFRSGSVPFSLRKIREEALKIEARAVEIAGPGITVELFEARFVGKYSTGAGASVLFQEVIDRLNDEGRIGSANAYRCSMKSLNEFRGDFPLAVVDILFLKAYELWMVEKGETLTTVGFYLRALRAIFNIAIEKKLISRDQYPFGLKGYKIPIGSNYKRALKVDDKVKFETLIGNSPEENASLAYWLFSYYCNGMNFTDMAYLKPGDLHDEVIIFVRRKTMRTVREVRPIVVPIRDEVREIIQQYGQHAPYCFGIIDDEMTPAEQKAKIRDWILRTNKYVNRVTKRAGIPGKVNTYTARHTFATMLLKGKADIKAIQQSLGHRSISTTESYLADLDLEEAKKISKLL